MSGVLQDRVVIVTGAGAGIGFGVLVACLAEVATVAGIDISPKASARIEAAGGHSFHCDVADSIAFAATVSSIRQTFGRLDGIVNNAGVTLISPFLEVDVDEWDLLWKVNQRSVLVGAQAAARIMVADQTSGAIVNVSSYHARASDVGYEGYAGTKGAISTMSRAMAWSLGSKGIRGNALCPGLTMTEAVAEAASDAARGREFASWHATGHVNTVDDIGRLAVFLLSDASNALTGAEIIADQGMTARLGALNFDS